ncbi:MAG: ChbG/HpnK family deacetylase [Deltaproteobacteria bacterium]|nr:ChbG/HpnK family deacetylase [Deltaproteobacteria bacterium]
MTSRFLIPVADDFGLSRGVNGGIIEAHDRGIVTSAALLMNFPALDDALSLTRAFPRLSIGLHVNVTIGRPITPWQQVPSLTNYTGDFLGLAGFLQRLAQGRISTAELSIEIDAQFRRYAETGLPLDFVNGQHHIHLFQPVLRLLAERLEKSHTRMLRLTHEPLRALLPSFRSATERVQWPHPKRYLFAYLARRAAHSLNGLASNDGFVHVDGAAFRRHRPESQNPFVAALRDATGRINELMCHPAHVDLPLRYIDAYVDEREVELRHLCDPALRRAIHDAGFALASYREIHP